MIEQLDSTRVHLDGLAQLAKELDSPLAEKELMMAKAWSGILKGTLGAESPYKMDGKRKTAADIEPTDAKHTYGATPGSESLVENIDNMRQHIATIITRVENLGQGVPMTREGAIARTQIWVHLVNARMELGFHLGRIRG